VEEGGAADGGAGAGVVVSNVSHAQVNDVCAVSHTHRILVSVNAMGLAPDCSI